MLLAGHLLAPLALAAALAQAAPVATDAVDGRAPTTIDAGPDASDDAGDDAGDDADAAPSDEPAASTPAGDGFVLPPPPPPSELNRPLVEDVPAKIQYVPEAERSGVVIKTILGLVALLVLAYVAGHPRVRAWERRVGVSQVITAGFPFVVLGAIARVPSVGILTEPVLVGLSPALRFGLGWIGFIIGFRFDARVLDELPRGAAQLVTTRATIAFLVIVASTSALLVDASDLRASLSNPVFLRDAAILGSAGALASLSTPRLLAARGCDGEGLARVGRVVRLQELAGLVGLLFVAAYFRPSGSGVTWQLPGTAWLLLTLGLGAAIGLLVYAILLRDTASAAESMVLILGSVAFASGIAASLRVSPVVVCFVAGLLIANFPGAYKETVRTTLARLERPIYLVFLLVVGALWRFDEARGWALMVVFVVARLLGNWLAERVTGRANLLELPRTARDALVFSPMGALSIAIVVNAKLLYPGGAIGAIVTAIVGGAIATEILVQLHARTPAISDPPSTPRGEPE